MDFEKYEEGRFIKAKYDLTGTKGTSGTVIELVRKGEILKIIKKTTVETPENIHEYTYIPNGIKNLDTIIEVVNEKGKTFKISLDNDSPIWRNNNYAEGAITYYDFFDAIPKGELAEKLYIR